LARAEGKGQNASLVRYDDSVRLRDSSTYDFDGIAYKQASGSAGLDGSGVFCDGRLLCLGGWSRGKVAFEGRRLVELGLKAKPKP
jgi:hypothetical protein